MILEIVENGFTSLFTNLIVIYHHYKITKLSRN